MLRLSRLSLPARLALPTVAAALAIAVTAPVVAEHVSAQPVRRDYRDEARLRAELDQVRGELGHYQRAYTELAAGLEQVGKLNAKNKDRRLKTQIANAIKNAERQAAQHVQPWSYDQQQPGWRDNDDWRRVRDRRIDPRAMAPVAMNDRDFRALSDQIGRAAFADDKLGIVKTAAQTNHFTVAQVITMMKLASFDDTRVEIAVACAPRVIDGDRWFEVYGALSFSSSREALRNRLGGR